MQQCNLVRNNNFAFCGVEMVPGTRETDSQKAPENGWLEDDEFPLASLVRSVGFKCSLVSCLKLT